MSDIPYHYHLLEYGGYFGSQMTTMKVLQSGFVWSTILSMLTLLWNNMIDTKKMRTNQEGKRCSSLESLKLSLLTYRE